MSSPPIVLSIAGSDCCAGAGVQADLKTCAALGTYGLTAVTAVVAETPETVVAIDPVSPEILREQVALLLASYPVGAIKTGMIASAAQLRVLSPLLAGCGIPLVVDPVMVASTGDLLSRPSTLAVYKTDLFPHATVMTPNLTEALALAGIGVVDAPSPQELARLLVDQYGISVLLTGGHLTGADRGTDILATENDTFAISGPWIEGAASHGTGCTLSAALAAGLASGTSLLESARAAKAYVAAALSASFRWDHPIALGALNHAAVKEVSDHRD